MEISSQEYQSKIGLYQDQALAEPVTVTKHGRPHIVIMSHNEYCRLTQPKRFAGLVSELSEEDIQAIEAAEVSRKYAYLDAELDE